MSVFQPDGCQPDFFWGIYSNIVPSFLENLGDQQPIYVLNRQSINGEKAHYLTIPEMANYYLSAILKVNPNGPYYLGGFSISAVIMYEIANQLCLRGKKVAFLLLIEPPTNLPHTNTGKSLKTFQKLQYRQVINKLLYIKRRSFSKMRQFMAKTFLRLDKKIPLKIQADYLLTVYTEAWRNYKPEKACDEIEKIVFVRTQNYNWTAWQALCQGKSELITIDCSHNELVKKPFLSKWLDSLKAGLETQKTV